MPSHQPPHRTDDSGNEVNRILYSPYGSVISSTGSLPTDRLYTGQRFESGLELYDYRARFYDPLTSNFLSPDSIVPDPSMPVDWNRYAYVRGNPVRYTDPSGHCPGCDRMLVETEIIGRATNNEARAFYLNAVEYPMGVISAPSSNPRNEQGYILYKMRQAIGPENVKHIPVLVKGVYDLPLPRGSDTRWQMFGEMFEIRTWTPVVADAIAEDIANNPLAPNEKLIIVGNSGGGTIAIESLDLLEERGIFVDQVILRGSGVQEFSLRNVGRVDYITSNFDPYYSIDINPFDVVDVQEHVIDFWFHTTPNENVRKQIGDLIGDLMVR